ncbi:hypothetical protein PP1Y_Lpl1321 (plasmid) [Novosphingobium sp. PP1Y]|nr:hypothetical protein PP1Y_Lpl1321 [Novosphingobium sp. PP1Y]
MLDLRCHQLFEAAADFLAFTDNFDGVVLVAKAILDDRVTGGPIAAFADRDAGPPEQPAIVDEELDLPKVAVACR